MIGRFITKDPLGQSDGPNLYLYCNNDPVNKNDPWGLKSCEESQLNKVLNMVLEELDKVLNIVEALKKAGLYVEAKLILDGILNWGGSTPFHFEIPFNNIPNGMEKRLDLPFSYKKEFSTSFNFGDVTRDVSIGGKVVTFHLGEISGSVSGSIEAHAVTATTIDKLGEGESTHYNFTH